MTRNRTVISDATHSKDSFSFHLFLQLKNEILCDLLVRREGEIGSRPQKVKSIRRRFIFIPSMVAQLYQTTTLNGFDFLLILPPLIENSLHQSRISFEVNILWWKWFFVLFFIIRIFQPSHFDIVGMIIIIIIKIGNYLFQERKKEKERKKVVVLV